jgi:hypothetical protein
MQKTKTLSQLKRTISQSQGEHGTTGYRPKGGDEQNFFDQHKIEVIDDAAGNGDEVFKGTGVKVIDRKSERHGYDHEEGKKVYDLRKNAEVAVKEELEQVQEGEDSHAQFQRYHNDTAKLLKDIHKGLSKHYDNVTDKKGYNGGQASWGHVGDIKNIHRQLQDIHDGILQHGEWAKPAQLKTVREDVEQVQELTKATLGSYVKKATGDVRTRTNMARDNGPSSDKHAAKAWKREDNISKAVDRITKEEVELDERSLSTGEMNKREDIVKGMKKGLGGFKARYGKDAKSVMYATATKLAKEEVEEDIDTSLLELWVTLDAGDRDKLSEMIDRGLEQEIIEFISEVDNG